MSKVTTISGVSLPTYRGWNLLCFAVLGFLAGRSTHGAESLLPIWLVAGWLFGMVALGVLSILLRLFFYGVVTAHGPGALSSGLSQGFLPLVPFTALALLADFVLGWDAAAAFTSAGLMFSGGATVSALRKLAPQECKGLVAPFVPSLAASGLALAWMVGVALLNRALGGLP